MTNIYIGAYGTSDKTVIKIEHEDGSTIGYAEVEEANLYLSTKHSWDAVLRGINHALQHSDVKVDNPNYHFHIGLGLKYTELIEAGLTFQKAKPNFIQTLKLESDGYVLCLGAHKENGAVIVLDEGTVGNAVNHKQHLKLGGWGFPHADQGSYPWIGMEAVRLTLQWIDGHIEPSPLLKAIYSHFTDDTYKLVQWAMQSRANPDEYLIICEIVINHLQLNDPYAIRLLQKSAEEANKIYKKLVELTGCASLPFCLFGYLAPYAEKYMASDVLKNITYADTNGIHGALKLIRGYVDDL
jgi:glucosamine kinase